MLPVRAVGPLSLGGATAWGECLGLDRLDSQLLLLHALGRPLSDRAWLLWLSRMTDSGVPFSL